MTPPPKLIFLPNRDLLSSTFLTFLLAIYCDLERFFDTVCHLSALLSSTSSNFELRVVILSIVPHFLKNNQKHTYYRPKKSKKCLVISRNLSSKNRILARFPRKKIKITLTIGPKFEKILDKKAEKCQNIYKNLSKSQLLLA